MCDFAGPAFARPPPRKRGDAAPQPGLVFAMTARSLYFTEPESVEVRERPVPEPDSGEVRVRTELSAVSPGTELLVYRGQVPESMPTDEAIDALDGTFSYPLQYGYAAVGRVTALGEGVDRDWLDRRVFAFHPHESHFLAEPDDLLVTDLPTERALLLPNAEAAVNFAMDARPRVGARVAVFGQGPVGLLTTAVLAEFPLAELVAVDRLESRRERARAFGADRAVPPAEVADAVGGDGPDITVELSGSPAALDDAIEVTGYAGQVIVGSWYGTKPADLDLGRNYHRSHIRMRSSQVSQVDPDHAGRWDKERRLAYVRSWLGAAEAELGTLLTHRVPVEDAADAYELLEEREDGVLQAAFSYG